MTKMTPEQSHYVLQALVARRRIRPTEIEQTLRHRDLEIRELRERLASLVALGHPRSRARAARRKPAPRRRRNLSPQVRALRRLQGRYMGFVRRLNAAGKARVKSVREKQGIEAAIRLASSLGKK
jgi:hypothetical protein